MNHSSNPQVNGKKPDIQWFKNNVVLKDDTNTLSQDAEQVSTDSFTCRVSNAVSSMTSDPVIQTCKPSEYYSVNPDVCLKKRSQIIFSLCIVQ